MRSLKMFANHKFQKIKENLFNPQKPFLIIISLTIIGISMLTIQHNLPLNSKEFVPPKPNDNTRVQLDTFIPKGFVLVPLEISNLESIEDLIGSYGLADLYPTLQNDRFQSSTRSKTFHHLKPLASRVRLIRAPNNSKLFGVLISEEERALILKLSDPVFAVLHNPNSIDEKNDQKTSQNQKETAFHNRDISYGEESP